MTLVVWCEKPRRALCRGCSGATARALCEGAGTGRCAKGRELGAVCHQRERVRRAPHAWLESRRKTTSRMP